MLDFNNPQFTAILDERTEAFKHLETHDNGQVEFVRFDEYQDAIVNPPGDGRGIVDTPFVIGFHFEGDYTPLQWLTKQGDALISDPHPMKHLIPAYNAQAALKILGTVKVNENRNSKYKVVASIYCRDVLAFDIITTRQFQKITEPSDES